LLVKIRQAFCPRHDTVVSLLQPGDQFRRQRKPLFLRGIHRMARSPQEVVHLERPLLILDLHQRFQLTQMMGVTQSERLS
jgi:hypothetical protein